MKIDFIAQVEGVEKTMPIIKASEYRHKWMFKMAQDYKKFGSLTQRSEFENTPFAVKKDQRHTSKCPGIIDYRNQGYIVRLHQDVKIDVLGDDEESYRWQVPLNDKTIGVKEEFINHHGEGNLYPFYENWPKDTLKKILKVNMPWKVRIPKDHYLLQMHPFYLDDFRFTTCSGILDCDLGIGSIMVPMFWHTTKGEELIKAGTPIAQLILIPKDEIEHRNLNIVTDPKFKEEQRISYLMLRNQFTVNYNKIKEFWKKRLK